MKPPILVTFLKRISISVYLYGYTHTRTYGGRSCAGYTLGIMGLETQKSQDLQLATYIVLSFEGLRNMRANIQQVQV